MKKYLFIAMIALGASFIASPTLAQSACGVSDVNALDDNKNTPLHRAIIEGDEAQANCLITAGAKLNLADANGMTALHFTVIADQLEIAEALIAEGVKTNIKGGVFGATPLHWTVWLNVPRIARVLIDADAEINATDGYGMTPFDMAVSHSRIRIGKMLLNAGGTCNTTCNLNQRGGAI